MASFMKILMDEYYARGQEALQTEDFEATEAWSQFESYANSCHGMSELEIIAYLGNLASQADGLSDEVREEVLTELAIYKEDFLELYSFDHVL